MSGRKKIEETGSYLPESHDAAASAKKAYDLAGAIAHDLNTILTTIYGYSELALESLDDASDAGRNVRMIIEAAHRARTLTGQLLDHSRRSAREKIPVKLSDALSETLDFIKPSVRNNITLIRELRAPDLTVEAVPEQLFRVFMNIAINAIQSMESAGGSLTVTLDNAGNEGGEEESRKNKYALIRFADTGKGMDAETSARMFDPFFTSGKKEQGTGLGLTIVHDIVSEMDGSLKVRSEKGRGTVIDLLLPVVLFGSLPGKAYLRNPKE
ncbi:MAG: ATP-binding protein [Bacteroidales bacterium]|nr:ATP-binding protein [Bacteroidales bacterium]